MIVLGWPWKIVSIILEFIHTLLSPLRCFSLGFCSLSRKSDVTCILKDNILLGSFFKVLQLLQCSLAWQIGPCFVCTSLHGTCVNKRRWTFHLTNNGRLVMCLLIYMRITLDGILCLTQTSLLLIFISFLWPFLGGLCSCLWALVWTSFFLVLSWFLLLIYPLILP
jgi:hypothetical protein